MAGSKAKKAHLDVEKLREEIKKEMEPLKNRMKELSDEFTAVLEKAKAE